MLARYRRTGADLPFGDPRRPHGVAMEGWFWRITDAAHGVAAVVLAGVNRDARGRRWGTVGLAAHPGGFARSAAVGSAHAAADGTLRIGSALSAGRRSLRVDLGPGARLEAELEPSVPWPRRRAFGGIGLAHAIPGLSQYWHPWLLSGRVDGELVAGGRRHVLDGATAYAEKNWSNGGFPPAWWWGQAHGFEADEHACVAFAGGEANAGPLRVRAGALVVAAGGATHRLVAPLQPLRVSVGEQRWALAGRTPGGVRLEVEGRANGTPPHLLPIPLPAEGRHLPDAATQHLAGELRVAVHRRGRTLFDGVSRLAGLEHGRAPRS